MKRLTVIKKKSRASGGANSQPVQKPGASPGRRDRRPRSTLEIMRLAADKFIQNDSVTWAGAFAFNAFYSLFPLIMLFVTIASAFIDHDRAGVEIIAYVERYVPISGDMQRSIFDTIGGVVQARGQAGAVAGFLLLWAAIQCFTTLIDATNRAWGATSYNWWRLPMKSLILFGLMALAVLLGIAVPVLATMAREWLIPVYDLRPWVYDVIGFILPLITVFLGLMLFYKLAPRRRIRFAEVWGGALCATVLLRTAEGLFVVYLKDFATLNAIYGAFGGVMALLLWIYLSGCIYIFGACLCAARAESLH